MQGEGGHSALFHPRLVKELPPPLKFRYLTLSMRTRMGLNLKREIVHFFFFSLWLISILLKLHSHFL